MKRKLTVLASLLPLALSIACKPEMDEPAPRPQPTAAGNPAPTSPQKKKAERNASPRKDSLEESSGDPMNGEFTLEQATAGLKGKGDLMAKIQTDHGTLECELFRKKAPTTVANFVGLARGLRPFKDGGEWKKKPAYDGTTFHRVIDGFMIQGGDPSGTGAGDPGYTIADEIWPGSKHDQAGLLCMANRGKNTNGMQFFITDGPAPHLDGGYTIFGECKPGSVIDKLSSVPTRGDRAVEPPVIEKVSISRKS